MKKLLSLVLALTLLVGIVPVYAEGDTELQGETEIPAAVVSAEPEEEKEEEAPAPVQAEEPPAPAQENTAPVQEDNPPAAAPAQEPAAPAQEPVKPEEDKQEEPSVPSDAPEAETVPEEDAASGEGGGEEKAPEIPVEEPEPEEEGGMVEKAPVDPPASLTLEGGSYNSAILSWTESASATTSTRYIIYYKDTNGVSKNTPELTFGQSPYTVTGLTCGLKYTFTIKAKEGTLLSNESAGPETYTPVPAKPTGLTLLQDPSTSVTLSWNEVDGASGYYIYRSVDGGEFTQIKQITSKTNTTYKDNGLTIGKMIQYQVKAYRTVNSVPIPGPAAEASIVELIPLAPNWITVQGVSSRSAKVTWAKVTGAESYEIWRSTSSDDDGDLIAVVAATTSAYQTYLDETDLIPGQDYYYHVMAVINNVAGKANYASVYQHEVAVVTGLEVTAQTADTISLKWDRDPVATKYVLEYFNSPTGSPSTWEVVGPYASHYNDEIKTNIGEYTVKNLDASTIYYFRISAVMTLGGSTFYGAPSNEILGSTKAPQIDDLEVAAYDYNAVLLQWVETGASDEVEIYRGIGTGTPTLLDKIASGTGYYIDSTVTAGKKYTYYVMAKVQVTTPEEMTIRSEKSNTVTCIPDNVAPGGVTATPDSATSVKLDWYQVNGANGYYVYKRHVGDDNFTLVQVLNGAANTTLIVTDLIKGEEYEFEVAAYRTVSGEKYPSKRRANSGAVLIYPSAPQNVTVTVVDATTLKISWKSLPGVAGYYLDVAEEDGVDNGSYHDYDGGEFFDGPVKVSGTSYTLSNLKTGRIYLVDVHGYVLDMQGNEVGGVWSLQEQGIPVPAAPASFSGSSMDSHTVKLTWSKVNMDAANCGYEILWSRDGLNYSHLDYISGAEHTEYIHSTDPATHPELTLATRYYKIRSYMNCESVNVVSKDKAISKEKITPVPATAKNLVLKSENTTTILLTFDGESNAVAEYFVERKEGSGSYKSLGKATWASDHWEYEDTGVKKGTLYTYRTQPVVGSNHGSYAVSPSGRSRPAKSASVTADCRNAATIRVSWLTVTGASGYEVWRSDSETTGYSKLGTTAKLYYDDKTVATGKTYFYRVRAYYTYGTDSMQYGEYAYLDYPQEIIGETCVPTPPEDFKLSSQTYNSVTLTWTPTAGKNCHYRLTYETASTSETLITDQIALKTGTYTVKDLQVGEEYDFYIYTVFKPATGPEMVSIKGTLSGSVKIVPNKVTGVAVTAKAPADAASTATFSAKVTWKETGGGIGYNVYRRKSDETTATKVGTVTGLEFFDDGSSFTVGEVYYYSVEAVGEGSSVGAMSAEVPVTVKPMPVTGLEAVSAGPKKVTLTCDDMSADLYYIYRSTSKGSIGSLIKKVNYSDFPWTDTGLTCGKTYYYTVKAFKSGFIGGGSTQVPRTPLPLAPMVGTATYRTAKSATLTWAPGSPAGEISGYQLVYRVSGATAWTSGGTAKAAATSGTVKVKATAKEYEFAVRAYYTVNGTKVYGPYSDVSNKVVLEPRDVTGLKVGTPSTANIPLSWDKQNDITGYVIYKCSTADGTYTEAGTSTTNSYKLTGIAPGTLVYIKVTTYVTQGGKRIESPLDTAMVKSGYINLAKPVLTLTYNGKTYCKFTWKTVKNAKGFEIRRKLGSSILTIEEIEDSSMREYLHDDSTAVVYDKKETYYSVRAFTTLSDGTKIYGPWSAWLKKPKK